MPFYEYECPACKYYAEVLQKISDKPLTKCPSCGKKGFKRLMSAPVFRLKGSGWYETDFKSDKDNQRNLLGAEREESKPETKSDSKTAAETAAPGAGQPKAEAAPAKTDKAAGATGAAAAPPQRRRSRNAAAKRKTKGVARRKARGARRR